MSLTGDEGAVAFDRSDSFPFAEYRRVHAIRGQPRLALRRDKDKSYMEASVARRDEITTGDVRSVGYVKLHLPRVWAWAVRRESLDCDAPLTMTHISGTVTVGKKKEKKVVERTILEHILSCSSNLAVRPHLPPPSI